MFIGDDVITVGDNEGTDAVISGVSDEGPVRIVSSSEERSSTPEVNVLIHRDFAST